MSRVLLCLVFLAGCAEQQEENTSTERALDLSSEQITQEIAAEETQLAEPEAVLGDMFEKENSPKTKVSGKVLTKEEAESLRNSVDGVQVELEVPTR